MRIDSAGRVGIGTNAPGAVLEVNGESRFTRPGTATQYIAVVNDSGANFLRGASTSGNAKIFVIDTDANSNGLRLNCSTAHAIDFYTNNTERARIDSSGRLLVGASASTALLGYNSGAQFAAGTGTVSIIRNTADNGACEIVYAKSRGTSGAPAIVASGDGLSLERFAGYDGAAYIEAARITAAVDGTPGTNDMPGRLVFSTTADGASSPTERMRIDSSGNVGIGGAPGSYRLDVLGSGGQRILNQGGGSFLEVGTGTTTSQSAYIDLVGDTTYTDFGFRIIRNSGGANANTDLAHRGTGGLSLLNLDAAPIVFYTTNAERARIDSSGRLLVGASASITAVTFPSLVQSNSFYSYQSSLFSADANGSNTFFLKSRNATTGSHTVVQANDVLGQINFAGSDGANFVLSANIAAVVDGTPGTNDMPGRLMFSTTADGAAVPTEQLRISNGGTVIYNQPAPAAVDVTATLTVANLTAKIITSSTAAAVTMTLPTGTLMDGGFSGLYNNMAFEWSVINTGATNAVTVQGGASHTVVGSGTVAANNSQRFLSRRTAATTWVTYRLT